jgi:hypothetical protein
MSQFLHYYLWDIFIAISLRAGSETASGVRLFLIFKNDL